MKNWKTTVAGLMISVPLFLSQAGVHIGHVGTGDFNQVISGIGALILGLYAKDKNVTGGDVQQ